MKKGANLSVIIPLFELRVSGIPFGRRKEFTPRSANVRLLILTHWLVFQTLQLREQERQLNILNTYLFSTYFIRFDFDLQNY